MKKFLFLLILIPYLATAQKQGNIWYFGDQGGLDFSNGNPVSLTDGQTYECMGHVEGSSVISDSTGSLLFYTNGTDIWNKNHQIMPNGTGLDGSISATQSSLILPLPGSNHLFYVFTVDGFFCGSNLTKGLRYTVVDMCLNQGKGEVLAGSKNISLTDSTAEKLTAVKDANGIDYWIITRKYYSHHFYVWHLTDSGLSGPFIYPVNLSYPPPASGATTGAIGQLKASPDGAYLASASGNSYNHIELYQFDNAGGAVFNPIELPLTEPNYRPYSVSFSPDNSKLYYSLMSINPTISKLIQYDLSGGYNLTSISATATDIWTFPNSASPYLGLQLAPNGKLYFMGDRAVINLPNLPGLASDFQSNAVNFSAGSGYLFPNFLDSFQYGNGTISCINGINTNASQLEISIFPNPNKGEFMVQLSVVQEASLKAELRNVLGQVVWQSRLPAVGGNVQEMVRTVGLSSGVYYLLVSSAKGNVVQKVVVE